MTRSNCSRDTKQPRNHTMPSGLAPVETIVLVVVLGFFLWLLLIFLSRGHGGNFRMTCGINLSRVGKAMLAYATDHDDRLPRAGGQSPSWGPVAWNASTRHSAHRIDPNALRGIVSVSSSLYLLVRYSGASPESFACPVDKGTRKWSGETFDGRQLKPTDCWDFGSNPQSHCSYSYHWPFGSSLLTTSSEPDFAVAADRSPWIPSPGRTAKSYPWSPDGKRIFRGQAGIGVDQLYGNSDVHQGDGQNVMFLDTHVTFEKRVYCGLEDDNIYTRSIYPDKSDSLGVPPVFSTSVPPANKKDSVLVHDPPTWPTPPS
jgi:hypothetical protein